MPVPAAIAELSLRLRVADAAEAATTAFRMSSLIIPLPIRRSSCIASASYDPTNGLLSVTFVNGGEATHRAGILICIKFIRAESAGSFYNTEIRHR
jgi:hypothetical protein